MAYLRSKSIRIAGGGLRRWTWMEQRDRNTDSENPDQVEANPKNSEPAPVRYFTPVTVWMQTWPDMLNATLAREIATEVLAIVARHDVDPGCVDVAIDEAIEPF